MSKRLWIPLIVALVALGLSPAAQEPKPPSSLLIDSLSGRDSFERYCAPCHGIAGRGDGPVARELRTHPPDLATLARRNDGAFPRDTVRGFITGIGRTVAAHGTTEMPIWGPLFRAFESDARARVRIENLVSHLESLQAPSTGPGDIGSQLFRMHCASCHGATGRGNGPLADDLRHRPPDLTTFTERNGGVFPRERVLRIIDGRDVPSHVDREMPIWGDVFKIRGLTVLNEVKDRIDAIVRYLEGIQGRTARLRGEADRAAG